MDLDGQTVPGIPIHVWRRALDEFVVEGIHTTIPIHQEIFRHPAFLAGQVDTTFIERTWLKKT